MTVDIAAAVRGILPSVRADLEELITIPSVSADPAASAAVHRSAELTAALLRAAGLLDVEILQAAGGKPAVVGHRPGPPGAPTVLLYAHHDVQPTGAAALWDSEPFTPTVVGDRLFARGAADDKAGIAVHLAALRAHGDELPVGIVVLIEGEEEIGSPTLPAFLATYADRLRADVMVLADAQNWAVGVPALTISLRGLVDCVVEVATLEHGIHSGMYGGAVPDALTALCRLLGTLHDEAGQVAVAGLTRSHAEALDLTEERYRKEAGVLPGVQLLGDGSVTERLWARPAVSVIGIDAPSIADAANTLLPSARAKISLRVAPGQRAAEAMQALTEHLQRHVPWGAHVTVIPGSAGEPFAADARGPAYDAARAAFAEAWGCAPVDCGAGGSIPFIAAFAEQFPAAAILVTGVEDPDTRAHGANESLHLIEFERACIAEALLLANLGGLAVG
ncbi:MAG TPA: dipeptidase [Mycobacteriales bacterium]|nr:dipeptidase [Mycobacteriales bacterium]